jgi:hypothetical protein
MVAIATLAEFASQLQEDIDTATANLLLLDQAQGLVTEQIGDRNPWPSIAKSIALAAAGRAYVNPDGLQRELVGGALQIYNTSLGANGVFLTEAERASLHRWANGPGGSTLNQPQGTFPDRPFYPDPAERHLNW